MNKQKRLINSSEYANETGASNCSNGCNYQDAGVDASSTLKRKAGFYILGFLIFIAGFFVPENMILKLIFFGAAYLIFGASVLLRATLNIATGKIFDENFLMSIATLGAFAIGEYPEGVAVMVFYQVGELLQDKAVDRSKRQISSLINIRPDYANLQIDGKTEKVNPSKVKMGDHIMVRPGERIPLDGIVIEGSSSIDLSALTGESLPRDVAVGDEVLSGSVNQGGLLSVKVSSEFNRSTVSRILSLVENASARKARTEQFITRFAAYYTPAVVFVALAIAFLPPLLQTGQELSTWVYRALVFLVISCPCALVISIPLGFFGGIGGASRRGILVKGGNYLEALSRIDTVIFDKTGTLTHGHYTVEKVENTEGFSSDQLLHYGAAAALHSTHPVARSVGRAWTEPINQEKLYQYQEIPGRGIRVQYDKSRILMGNRELLAEEGLEIKPDKDQRARVYLAVDGRYAGSIIVSDELKEDAAPAVDQLRKLGVNRVVMLTGDKKPVAEDIGRRLNLDQVYAELLPDQKLAIIEKLEKLKNGNGKNVFVGDGINDAPALARAEIGVAMGGVASDAAIEAADIVLMTGQPLKLVEALQIARKTKNIVMQNIVLALGVKAVIMALGLFGFASMWGAVFADVGVALLATLNAIRAMH